MAAKPLTNEAIALTEKKMGMTLDDIIKMSVKNIAKPPRKPRISNRSQKISSNFAQDKSSRIGRVMDFKSAGRVMDIKSALRQGALAQKRSSFQANSFPLATQTARKAAVAPIRNGPINRSIMVNKPRSSLAQRRAASGSGFSEKQREGEGPKQQAQTLDSRFAKMKTQRSTEKKNIARRNASVQRLPPWHRARFSN